MKLEEYFDYIEEHLNFLSLRIERRATLNLHDINIKAEYFFMHFLNMLYDWKLVNLNDSKQNTPGVDLLYSGERILIQVSSTNTTTKIQESLNKIDTKVYSNYTFKFLSISKDAKNLRNKTFKVPNGIIFDPGRDILDVPLILRNIQGLPIDKMEEVYNLIKKNLSFESPSTSRMKGLSRIIQLLAEDGSLSEYSTTYDTSDFEIAEKIKSNNLSEIESKIADIGVYLGDVQKVYNTYDAEGVNKSRAVLHSLNCTYLKLKRKLDGIDLMEELANEIYKDLSNDETLKSFYEDDIKFYIDIVLVDAFVRCKIFENPKMINNDTSR